MKIHSTNWNQKQFVDQASAAPDNNSEGWHKVPFKQGNTCQIKGRNFQVIGKMERHLPMSSGSRIGGIALGVLLSVGTLGLAPLFSKKVRQLFTGRQVQVVVKEILQNKGAQPQVDPSADKAKPGGSKDDAAPPKVEPKKTDEMPPHPQAKKAHKEPPQPQAKKAHDHPPTIKGKIADEQVEKPVHTPKILTSANATDSSRFVKGDHNTANWEQYQGDIAFALNCCDYPKLAAYIANKHGKNINETCGLINAFEFNHPGIKELTAQDILPMFAPSTPPKVEAKKGDALPPQPKKADVPPPKVEVKKPVDVPTHVTYDNVTDSTPFAAGYGDVHGWEKFEPDLLFADNCCDYPKLAAYIANKHNKNINKTCQEINGYMQTHPGTKALTANDILPLLK